LAPLREITYFFIPAQAVGKMFNRILPSPGGAKELIRRAILRHHPFAAGLEECYGAASRRPRFLSPLTARQIANHKSQI
jgi:hypothetical protein